MITLNDALTANEFWHMTHKNADGSPMRCRKTGSVQTWKKRPGIFKMPVKHGLKLSFYITNAPDGVKGQASANHADWCTPERWPAEHVLFEGLKYGIGATVTSERTVREAFANSPQAGMEELIRLLGGAHA